MDSARLHPEWCLQVDRASHEGLIHVKKKMKKKK